MLAACETLTSLPHHKIHMLSESDDVFSLGCGGKFSIKRWTNATAEETALWTNGRVAVIGLRLLFGPGGALLTRQARYNHGTRNQSEAGS